MKRLICILLILMLCLTGCNLLSGTELPTPEGRYTDESESVCFVFTQNSVTIEDAEGVIATGSFTMSGLRVDVQFEGEYSEYLNALGDLTYQAATDSLTDDAGTVLTKVNPA